MSLPAMSSRRVRWGREKPSYTGQMWVTPSPESTTTPVRSPGNSKILDSWSSQDGGYNNDSETGGQTVWCLAMTCMNSSCKQMTWCGRAYISQHAFCANSLYVICHVRASNWCCLFRLFCSCGCECCGDKHTLSVESQDGLDGDINSCELVRLKHHLDEERGQKNKQKKHS